ncbi:MAG: VOC family protein [Anaerolineales bacterium]|nr:VOC family protein [Chloroflexota bacterium]MBL6983640.1 VOC family protein [Anaerolineales bacterium]
MASIKGIGGVFIDSNDAEKLANWYQSVLGIKMETHPDGTGYYRVFLTRDIGTSVIRENPVFAINQVEEHLPTSGRGFTLNLRVDDLDQFLEQLQTKNVKNEGKILEWERGRHAWIHDLDGNRIELYEEILLNG